MIEIKGLYKSFGDLEVLKDIDLQVKKGEILVIIGPSGSGKSTLLRCLNYLEKPNSGIIRVNNTKIDSKNVKNEEIYSLRKESAMVFQNYNLFNNKTVMENITEALVVVRKMEKSKAIKIGEELLKKVGLIEKRDSYPNSLSGGQKQRVAIARAMALKPSVILFDEPTSALDPELVGEVLEVMRDLTKLDITSIIVTHEMEFAKDVADRVIFMDNGKIVEMGSPNEIFSNPSNERTKEFLRKVIGK
ncbi:amino acid ABC transporter ATP-binding protein [Anaeromicrobium sediminis]|uniref:Amino acid ABC transporter ATP-binding protein n=1 Tax=Anaeromicrobium sediminis TaxID=1478221 RepID=A0A267MM42_9FIRM|nr:amino acid ABC transporter ATP-binding protein [Anaeromicrobium sediminis]PAB60497.1 amino acid ABC transporter ATP-binding protein [Anaeromicrobium sediminis]